LQTFAKTIYKEEFMAEMKPRMSLSQIINMNFGFLGIQFSFGLQQANMSPIYNYLGADEASLPLLWLAGPMTGLIVQPIIGALSDRTTSRMGRRTPYFLIGAILCSLCLLAMPYSPALWMAASLLWILDAANNVTMEPYRAFVSDKLNKDQHAIGFLTQSAFTGLAQTLAYLAPSLLVWFGMNKDAVGTNHIPQIVFVAFVIGAILSSATVLWSVYTTREDPLPPEVLEEMKRKPFGLMLSVVRTLLLLAIHHLGGFKVALWYHRRNDHRVSRCRVAYRADGRVLQLRCLHLGVRDGAAGASIRFKVSTHGVPFPRGCWHARNPGDSQSINAVCRDDWNGTRVGKHHG
jgi:MFS family permease